jgi:hypothetical protein
VVLYSVEIKLGLIGGINVFKFGKNADYVIGDNNIYSAKLLYGKANEDRLA